ncbi:hypothetical protein DL93DRAFT_2070284 [Clavulina sp. PMI_390]|nr:hypothetical protein DL93DRAFT_2070284 [Clavulina sp. PMI_390]
MSLTVPSPFIVAIWNAFVPPAGLLTGCLLSSIFLGVVTIQSARYWEVFRQDKVFNIGLVLFLLILNASGCIAFTSLCYTHVVSAFGNTQVMTSNPPIDWRYLYAQSAGLVTVFVVLITLTIPVVAILKSRLLAVVLDTIVLARTGLGYYQIYVLSQASKHLGSSQITNLLVRISRVTPILIVVSDIVVALVLCGALLYARSGNPINDSAIDRLFNTLLPCIIAIVLWQLGLGIGIWTDSSSVATVFSVPSPLFFNIAYLAALHARSQLTSPDLMSLDNPLRWAFARRKVEPWSTAITVTQERVQQAEEGAIELRAVARLSLVSVY